MKCHSLKGKHFEKGECGKPAKYLYGTIKGLEIPICGIHAKRLQCSVYLKPITKVISNE